MKTNSARSEIQYHFMFTSRASARHHIDFNDCELSHSDEKRTSELNKRANRGGRSHKFE